MRVHTRLMILTTLLGLVFLAGFLLLQENQRNQLILVNNEHQAEYNRFLEKILAQEDKEMRIIVIDYTYWDEMVAFVKSKDPDWAKNTLESALANYQVDAIWVYQPDLNLIYSTSTQPDQRTPAIPFTAAQLQTMFQSDPVLSFSFRLEDGRIMEVCGSKIVPGNDPTHSGPAQGYFFAGRVWGTERARRIAEMTDAQIEIIGADKIQPTPITGSLLYAYAPIQASDGQPLAYIRGSYPNTFTQGFNQAQQRDLNVYLVLTFTMLVLLGSGLGFWVARPLAKISRSLSSGNVDPIVSLFNDRSELGLIARLIREFFQQRVEMANQIDLLKKTEIALRSGEQRYRILTEIISDVTYSLTINSEGHLIPEWGQEAMNRISGVDVIGLIFSHKVLDIIHPDDRSAILDWPASLLKGNPVTSELRLVKPGGETLWIRNHMMPILDETTHQVIRIYGVAQDITRQHNAEETYRTLVNHSQQGLIIAQDWVLKFVNPAFVQMSGNTREELLAMKERELISRIDSTSLRPIYLQLQDLLDGKLELLEIPLHIRHKDQSWRWLNVVFETVEFMGNPAIQATCVDITEHILAAEALKEQTDYSNILFSTVNSVVIILASDGRVTACNPTAQQICGCESAAPENTYLWDLLDIPEDTPLSHDRFAALIQNQSQLDGVEFSILSQGKLRWLSWSQRYKTDSQGNVVYVVGTAVDITEQVFREQQREAIAGIASALRGGTTRQETILSILDKVKRFTNVYSVGIAFPMPETEEFLIEFVNGELQEILEGKRFKLSESVTGTVLKNGQPYITQNLREEQNLAMPSLKEKINSVAWIPLISESNAIGVLLIGSQEAISQEMLVSLLPIADMAAWAVDRSERYEQAQRQIQQLSAMQSINMTIGASLDLNITFNVLTVQMTTQLGVDAADVLLLNPQTSQLTYAAGNGFRSKDIEKTVLWLGEYQAGRAAMERRSIHLYDPDGVAKYFNPPGFLADEGFVAYDVVPLIVKGEVRGVIETFHRKLNVATKEWRMLLDALALETSIAIDNTELLAKLQRSNQDLQIAFDGTLQGLARMLEIYDYETEKHSLRVVDLTVKLAQYLGINSSDLTNIRRGAYMHDIGKIGIPREILNKTGKLDPDEWAEVVKHPQYAYDIINPIPFLQPALEIPFSHHERWNGKGYPQKLAGEEIPLAARIFAVIDIFDALTSERKYREALTPQEALNYLAETAGKELDPKIVRAFLDLYPLLKRSPFDNL
jgi:PAS domain S-box-containing protein